MILMRLAIGSVLALSSVAAQAGPVTLELPGQLDRQSVAYACNDGSTPKVAYYNLPDQSFAVIEIEAGRPRVFVAVPATSGTRYVSGPYLFWTRGNRADISDERRADQPAATCKVTR